MLDIESNMLQFIFYSPIKGDVLRTAQSTLRLKNFIPNRNQLRTRTKFQVPKNNFTTKSLQNIISPSSELPEHFNSNNFIDVFN